MKRRSFLALIGAAPVAGKAAIDAEIAKGVGMDLSGLGNAAMGLPGGSYGVLAGSLDDVPYEKRLIGAADYIKLFGLPQSVEANFRDQAKYVTCLDPDIASKRSWSMAVKIMTQRERNYHRAVERVKVAGWQERGRQNLKKLLGFDWPW